MARPDTWFRMYAEVVDDPKVQQLPDKLFKVWVNLLCVATRSGGMLPPKDQVAFKLRITEAKVNEYVETFLKRELFDATADGIVPHNWNARQYKSDVSSDRVKRFRNRERNVSETPTEQSMAEKMDANASTAPTPIIKKSKPRRARLENTWQPSADDYQFAVAANLEHAEIAADIIEFVAYWTGPEPAKPAKADWSKTYRNHITDYAPRIIARRPRVGKSFANSNRGGGLAAYLRESLVEEPLSDGAGVPGFGSDVPDDGGSAGGFGPSESDSGSVIDADEWQRVEGVADETSDVDGVKERAGRGSEVDDGDLSRAASGVSGGRDAICAENGDGQCGVVACVGGFEIPPGFVHQQTQADAAGDEYADLPAFLDVRTKAHA